MPNVQVCGLSGSEWIAVILPGPIDERFGSWSSFPWVEASLQVHVTVGLLPIGNHSSKFFKCWRVHPQLTLMKELKRWYDPYELRWTTILPTLRVWARWTTILPTLRVWGREWASPGFGWSTHSSTFHQGYIRMRPLYRPHREYIGRRGISLSGSYQQGYSTAYNTRSHIKVVCNGYILTHILNWNPRGKLNTLL